MAYKVHQKHNERWRKEAYPAMTMKKSSLFQVSPR